MLRNFFQYNLVDLVEKCEKFLSENLNAENVLLCLQICEQIDLRILRIEAIKFIQK